MTGLFNLFSRHHIQPGQYWELPYGEQVILMAFSSMEKELEDESIKQAGKGG